jgi:pimeloyl-ACP methyl ester carboxylesterase
LALVAPLSAGSQEPITQAAPLKGQLVEIGGGRRLNILCIGSGSPTVLFLQGLGGGITAWQKVRGPVASITRACFYDRAGFGYSDPSNRPATAEFVTEDLHALLRASGIEDNIVLVGHSLGGLFATVYADKYPGQVKGLVLIDPSFAEQFDYHSPQAKKLMRSDENQFISFLNGCQTQAKEGKLSRENTGNCFHIPQNATEEELDYLLQQGTRATYYASGISEIENFFPLTREDSIDGMEEAKRKAPFGNKPVVVLSAGNRVRDSRLSDPENNEVQEFLKRGHEALAARSSEGNFIVVPQSGHDVQVDKPDAVVGAIRNVVFRVRQIDGH